MTKDRFSLHRYANPAQFGRIASTVLPWAAGAAILLLGSGLYFALFASPPDYQQSETVRIMYVHVPAAIMSELVYGLMAAAAAAAIHLEARASGRIRKGRRTARRRFHAYLPGRGLALGTTQWGTYWVWDARLTSELILFFLYLGYIALVDAFDDPQRGLKAGAILVLVGAIDLPIIKFSVDWWNTLHQSASISLSGSKIHPSMLLPYGLMIGGFLAFFITVALMRVESELLARRIRARRTAFIEE